MIEGKDQLNELFKLLRKRKLIARQNHLCCGGCASASIGHDLDQPRNQDKRGGVYYHSQDAACLPDGYVYLGYGARPEDPDEKGQEIGMEIMKAAYEVGLPILWNGSSNQRIQVILNKDGV